MSIPQDTPLSGEKLNEERAFVKRYTEGLSAHKVEYQADYSAPLEDRPRKVPAVGITVADPPESMDVDDAGPVDAPITITVKSLKPPLTIPITVQLTDTVTALKNLIAESAPSAPRPSAQRLLLKGKALADTKLLKEYDIGAGATVHLMLKPGANPDSPSVPASASSPAPVAGRTPTSPTSRDGRSQAPPSLTITTSVSDSSQPLSINDISQPPLGPQPQVSTAAFHNTVADPKFWQKIHALCVSEFAYEGDADLVWETFLVAMKAKLSAGEAAKIRDVVGVRGMGGGA